MELTIKVAIQKELMTRQAADIAHRMSEFESRVLLKRQNLTVNAKSLPDEAQAVCTLSKLLGA